MGKGFSKKRMEMGEEKWAEYQRNRKNTKANNWRSRNSHRVVNWRRRAKKKLIEYKGGKCQVCGYDKDCPAAYDFHHRDPATKSFSISHAGNIRSLDRMMEEVDKCDLLCCRCHAELHAQEYENQRKEGEQRHQEWLQKRSKKSDS